MGSHRGAAPSRVSGGLEDQAGSCIAQRMNRRFHATKVMVNEEIPLMSNTSNNGDVHRAGRKSVVCLIERDVELTATGIRDEVWSLNIEVCGNVERGHVRKATERQQGIQAVVADGRNSQHREFLIYDRTIQQLIDVGPLKRNVADRQEHSCLLTEILRQRRILQCDTGRDYREVILHAHELPILAHLEVRRRIARRVDDVAESGDDYRIVGEGWSPSVHSL